MEITKLISVFERLLPLYKEALELKSLWDTDFWAGICMASEDQINEYGIRSLFGERGYYRNLTGSDGYLFPCGDLQSRIHFMESEIKDLKRLIKKGYTHV